MTPRRRGVCVGFSNVANGGRLGGARRVWPPAHVAVAYPGLGVAAIVSGGRFRARASFRDLIKSRGAGAGGGGGGGEEGDKDDAVSKLIDKYGDQMGEVGFGGVVGFCSGYAMMKVGKTVAFFIGLGFIITQGLNYTGVVAMKWDRAEAKAKSLLDSNKDGKLDKEDIKAYWKRIKTALTHNLTAGGGFSGGFALGLCCG